MTQRIHRLGALLPWTFGILRRLLIHEMSVFVLSYGLLHVPLVLLQVEKDREVTEMRWKMSGVRSIHYS